MDKVEVIRRGYEAARLRDADAAAELLAADAVWHSAIGPMLGKTEYVGYDGISELVFREIPSVLEDFRPDVLEIRDLGGDLALAIAVAEIRLRHAYADWNRSDFAALVAAFHPDVVIEQDPRMPGAETFRGHDGVRHRLERFDGAWETRLRTYTDPGEAPR